MSNKVNPLNSLAKPKHNVREAISSIPDIGKLPPSKDEDITNPPRTYDEHMNRDIAEIRNELFQVWKLAYQAGLAEAIKRGMSTLTQNTEVRTRLLEDCKNFADLCLENYMTSRKATISHINDCTDSYFKGE